MSLHYVADGWFLLVMPDGTDRGEALDAGDRISKSYGCISNHRGLHDSKDCVRPFGGGCSYVAGRAPMRTLR